MEMHTTHKPTVDEMVRELGNRAPQWNAAWVAIAGGYNIAIFAKTHEEAVQIAYDRMLLDRDEENTLAGALEGHERGRWHVNMPTEHRDALLKLVEKVEASPFVRWWLGLGSFPLYGVQRYLSLAVESSRFREVVETHVRRRVHKAVQDHAESLKAVPPATPPGVV